MEIGRLALAGALALCACAGLAADQGAPSWALEGGGAQAGSYTVSVGLAWPWQWSRRRTVHGGEWTGATELFVSHWSARVQGEREASTQVGALPVIRYRFGGGSDWFAAGGIGLTWMDAHYRNDDHQFSTRFNFVSVLGVGRSFGARREQALSLRVSHFSNGGIENPNPGENFLQLRYTRLL
jgi:lipid A 3-O-deacylase